MARKPKNTASDWIDPDDAPIMTAAEIARAGVYEGDKLISRGRGRPRLEPKDRKVAVNLRLPPAVVGFFRAAGPGWQTRISETVTHAVAKRIQKNAAAAAILTRPSAGQMVEKPKQSTASRGKKLTRA